MNKTIQEWTMYFLGQGFGLIEARQKASDRIAFEKEVDNINIEEIPRVTL